MKQLTLSILALVLALNFSIQETNAQETAEKIEAPLIEGLDKIEWMLGNWDAPAEKVMVHPLKSKAGIMITVTTKEFTLNMLIFKEEDQIKTLGMHPLGVSHGTVKLLDKGFEVTEKFGDQQFVSTISMKDKNSMTRTVERENGPGHTTNYSRIIKTKK